MGNVEPNDCVRSFLFHEAAQLGDRCRSVAAIAAEQQLDALPRHRCTRDSIGGLRSKKLRAAVDQRELGSCERALVAEREEPLAVRDDTDSKCAVAVAAATGCDQ